ncbi:hypothetical protein D3C73_1339350 [compost metagenome]
MRMNTIFLAEPLSSISLPIIAPNAKTITILPSVLPIPLLMALITLAAGIPKSKPVIMATASRAIIGLIFFKIKTNSRRIPRSKMNNDDIWLRV